ncbi:GntR family transcriptional regulator [Ottowia thiooxydans]|uniref:GntR family transcriptional regulator n=1 Tax=Ottowia thiooxydans TaxID=219182 RepID=UPI000414AC6A|nr:GntR family transcriptional regulator [Ottowia thiooxydans]
MIKKAPTSAAQVTHEPVPAQVRQQVAGALRNSLEGGKFTPGERLIERDLCVQMGVSRPSLREALRELESEGLVTSIANRGVFVSVLSVRDVREIYEVREQLEGLIAARFAQFASRTQLARFESAAHCLFDAYECPEELISARRDFYEALWDGADHDLATSMLRGIQLRANQLRRMTLADPDRMQESVLETKELVAAIRARDPGAAAEVAKLHVRKAATTALRLMERDAVSVHARIA